MLLGIVPVQIGAESKKQEDLLQQKNKVFQIFGQYFAKGQ
jgi:hypothetical protein